MKTVRNTLALLSIIAITTLFTACGSSSSSLDTSGDPNSVSDKDFSVSSADSGGTVYFDADLIEDESLSTNNFTIGLRNSDSSETITIQIQDNDFSASFMETLFLANGFSANTDLNSNYTVYTIDFFATGKAYTIISNDYLYTFTASSTAASFTFSDTILGTVVIVEE